MLSVKAEGRDSNTKKNFKNIAIKSNTFLLAFKHAWKRKNYIGISRKKNHFSVLKLIMSLQHESK